MYSVLVAANMTIREALQRLCDTAKGALFIVEKGRLVASLTDGDVRRFLLQGGEINACIEKAFNKSPKFLFSSERERAHSYMKEQKIAAIPIVDEMLEVEDVVFLRDDEVDIDSVKIRELRNDDLGMVLDFFDQMAGDTRAMFNRNDVNRLRAVRYLQEKSENELHFCATVERSGVEQMVGYVFVWDINKGVPWLGIAVHENWKGRHLGRRLLSYLDDWACMKGVGGLLLTSVAANIRAHSLYERMGYEYCGTYPNGEFLYLKRFNCK